MQPIVNMQVVITVNGAERPPRDRWAVLSYSNHQHHNIKAYHHKRILLCLLTNKRLDPGRHSGSSKRRQFATHFATSLACSFSAFDQLSWSYLIPVSLAPPARSGKHRLAVPLLALVKSFRVLTTQTRTNNHKRVLRANALTLERILSLADAQVSDSCCCLYERCERERKRDPQTRTGRTNNRARLMTQHWSST